MNRENLKKSGLLEQYVLGLTSREETRLVEHALREDPGVVEDYEALRRELDAYIGASGLVAPDGDREIRTSADYEELDHEMFRDMTERNNSLVVWRYSLIAACLLLLCLSGYLFRLSETNRSEIVSEKAHHAQDNNAHKQALKKLEKQTPDWQHMQTLQTPAIGGRVVLHYLNEQDLVLLDLSHAEPLSVDDAYFIFMGDVGEEATHVVPAGHQFNLHPLEMPDGVRDIKVFRWKIIEEAREINMADDLVAALSLPAS